MTNLTSTTIPLDILNFLSLGPKFCLPTSKKNLDIKRLLMEVEGVIAHCNTLSNKDLIRAKATNVITNFLNNNQPISSIDNYLNRLGKKTQFFKGTLM